MKILKTGKADRKVIDAFEREIEDSITSVISKMTELRRIFLAKYVGQLQFDIILLAGDCITTLPGY